MIFIMDIDKIEDIITNYSFGDCAIFAVALSKKYPLPIVEFYSHGEMFHVALVIPGTLEKNDLFLDVNGINTLKDIKKRYGVGKIIIEQKTENELKAMSLFSEKDLLNALKDLEYLLFYKQIPTLEEIKPFKSISIKSQL